MTHESVPRKFNEALDALIEQIKQDRSVLAAILCGSLAHDTVWARSDIDLVLVTVDDKKIPVADRALYADGVNVHALLLPRAAFRTTVEGAIRNSFAHAFLAKGRLLYTHDPTIADLCARLGEIGTRDTELQRLSCAASALGAIDKAHKWLLTRGDLEYSALYILYAATPLAKIEVLDARLIADREVLPQALRLNPSFFNVIYRDLLNTPKTREAVTAALDAIDRYLAGRATTLFAPLLDYLRDVGDVRSATDIEDQFKRNFGIEGVITACEYLADQRVIGKASTPVRLTARSSTSVEELAFFHIGGESAPDGR